MFAIRSKCWAVAAVVVGTGLFAFSCFETPAPPNDGDETPTDQIDPTALQNSMKLLVEGQRTFRFETFGDEAFWGGALRLHEAIAGSPNGGTGAGLSPEQALELGLKVDSAALSSALIQSLRRGEVDLGSPAVTLDLLRANAVIGVTGFFGTDGRIRSVGIQCSLCHSTVDDSVLAGIGRRRDGWPNRDLNVGQIIALSPTLQPFVDLLEVDEATVRTVLASWGPGKFDALLALDGKATRPDGRSAATLIPPVFGLAGVNLSTWTGWGSVTHWNGFVANIEMHGQGTFFDPRLDDAERFPVAARNNLGNIRHSPDLVTPKLAALHFYQLSLPSPAPPSATFNQASAERGKALFEDKAGCARCHVPPLFTEPGWNMHTAAEIGIDDFQANRSPDSRYRTAPLKGLWAHSKGGFYHDGRFATLEDVVEHYDAFLATDLSANERADLVEYLKSL